MRYNENAPLIPFDGLDGSGILIDAITDIKVILGKITLFLVLKK